MYIEELATLLSFGKPKRKIQLAELQSKNFEGLPYPVFFLSTGRTGTGWFANLLKNDKKFKVYHGLNPPLTLENKFYYEKIWTNPNLDLTLKKLIAKNLFTAARGEYLWYAYKTEKHFIETQDEYVFLAYGILEAVPNAKFIHLIRHPGEVIRSRLNRGWYQGDNSRRIQFYDYPNWNDLDPIEKNAVFWLKVNQFIEDFKKQLPANQVFVFNFNELNLDTVKRLIEFIGVEISERKIKKLLNKKVNINKVEKYKPYSQWSKEDKLKIWTICGELAEKYGYRM